MPTYYSDTTNDWEVYQYDEDDDNKFCIWDSATFMSWFPTATTTTPYRCTEMKCTMTRIIDTGSTTQDFKLDLESQDIASATDTFVVGLDNAYL